MDCALGWTSTEFRGSKVIMRMSLLLKQEPFGKVLEETLKCYWDNQYHSSYALRFASHDTRTQAKAETEQQVWFGNIYLNFFAVRETPVEAFDNLKSEYQHTPVRWRRWPQKAYVHCAIKPMFRKCLAQAALHVTPAIPDAHDTLILGGNRRLRLLHPSRGTSTVLLKQGYPKKYLTHEVAVRQRLQLDFSPELKNISLSGGWYEETYVKGTPLNRLVLRDVGMLVETVHTYLLEKLVEPTLEAVNVHDYIARAISEIEALDSSHITSDVVRIIQRMAGTLSSSMTEIPVSMTHGDFQPANILYDGHQLTVIDWECVAERHAAYDALVYLLGVRQTSTWSAGLGKIIMDPPLSVWRYWPGLSTRAERRLSMLIFLLDELNMLVLEAFEVSFRKPSGSLKSQLDEMQQALVLLGDL
jgi:hypothetical protein